MQMLMLSSLNINKCCRTKLFTLTFYEFELKNKIGVLTLIFGAILHKKMKKLSYKIPRIHKILLKITQLIIVVLI